MDSSYLCKYLTIFSIIFFSCLFILIIIPLLIGLSVSVVDPMDYGIEVDGNTRQINRETLYSGGRYFLGLNHYFISFPRYNQYLLISSSNLTNCKYIIDEGNSNEDTTFTENSIVCRTKDGIKLIVDLSVEFQLGTQKLNDQLISQLLYIFNSVGFEWSKFVINISKGVTMDIFTQYNVSEVYSKRTELQALLFDELSFQLASHNFQLNSALILKIEFPRELVESLESVESALQNILSNQAFYTSLRINSTSLINNASIDSQIINYSANNKAQEIMKVKYSIGNAINTKYYSLFQSLYNFKNTLNIRDKTNRTAASQLLTYYWLKVMQNNGNSQKLVNLEIIESLK